MTINVNDTGEAGHTGEVAGSDDGIVLLSTGGVGFHKFGVNNAGIIAGEGLSGDLSNASEGIHVSRSGTFGSGNDINGSVDIENSGFIFGSPAFDGESYATNGGGQGVSISADGFVQVDNFATAYQSVASNLATTQGAAIILGADGVKVTTEDGVFINNSAQQSFGGIKQHGGLIIGYDGNGVSIVDSYVNEDGVTIDNSGTRAYDGQFGIGPEYLGAVPASEQFGETIGLATTTSRGIWGSEDGVYIDEVNGGSIDIENGNTDVGGGLIVGLNGDAVHISNVTDFVDPHVGNVGGLLWAAMTASTCGISAATR